MRLVVLVLLFQLGRVDLFGRRVLVIGARDWVLVAKDKVILVIGTALVRAEHDCEWRGVVKCVDILVILAQQLHVGAAALDAGLKDVY